MTQHEFKGMPQKQYTMYFSYEAFWGSIYAQKAIRKLTIDDICQATGVSRNQFYRLQRRADLPMHWIIIVCRFLEINLMAFIVNGGVK